MAMAKYITAKPQVQLTLTAEEAEVVVQILGILVRGGGPAREATDNIYTALSSAGVSPSRYAASGEIFWKDDSK